MYYVPYEQKILKIARIRDQIYKFRFLILGVILAIISAIVALLAVKGNIMKEVEIQASYVYGEQISPTAKAFMSDVSYEYYTGKWTEEQPVRPGEYRVRAKAKAGFGGYKYGVAKNFTITQKELSFRIPESVTYGNMPKLSFSGLVDNDVADESAFAFEFSGILTANPSVMLQQDSLHIISASLGDVTECYHIDESLFAGVDIRILPRPITVQVCDAEKMYDGTPLVAQDYTLANGTLVDGDAVSIDYTGEQLVFGQSNSSADIRLTNENGENVTALYKIQVKTGILNVTKRPIEVTTGSADKVYDGEYLICDKVWETGAYQTVESEEIQVLSCTELLEVGSVNNLLKLAVWTKDGEDRSDCYEIAQRSGLLEIIPRKVGIALKNTEKVYDGKEYTTAAWDFVFGDGLVVGEILDLQVVTKQGGTLTKGKNVGEYVITIDSFSIYAGERDATKNYEFTCQDALLKITKRYAEIYVSGAQKIYDARPYSATDANEFYTVSDTYPLADNEYCLPDVNVEPYIDAGVYENAISVVAHIYDVWNEETTSNYEIKTITNENSTRLTITKRPIEIYLVDCERPYNGKPLTSTLYRFDVKNQDRLMPVGSHLAVLTADGSITEPGSVTNNITSVKMMQGANDVTKNYDIKTESGTLTVTKRFIQVAPLPYNKIYDGEKVTFESDFPLYALWCNESDKQYGAALLEGYTLHGRTESEDFGNVGIYASYISINTFYILDDKGNNVTEKYFDVTFVNSTVTIKARELHVASMDVEHVFKEGMVLSGKAEDCYIAKGSLADGDSIAYEVRAELSEVGSTVNRIISITLWDKNGEIMYRIVYDEILGYYIRTEWKFENYVLEITCGTLTFLPVENETV